MGSSKKLASIISTIASTTFFFLIIFQLPLFRIQCRSGICKTPIEMICSHLVATQLIPEFVAKTLLYPCAFAKAIIQYKNMPSFNSAFNSYKFTNVNKSSSSVDLHHLEVLAGSYLSVAGALQSFVTRSGRLSSYGILLIFWGLIRDVALRTMGDSYTRPTKASQIFYPAMLLAASSALLSVRKDVRKFIRSSKTQPAPNPSRLKRKYM